MSTAKFAERGRLKHGPKFDYAASRYQAFTKPIECFCKQHGQFCTTPKTHLHTRSGGCPGCRSEQLSRALRKSSLQFVQDARDVHGDMYDYSLVDYQGVLEPVAIGCPVHGVFWMRPARHLEGRGCKQCKFQEFSDERRLTFWQFIEAVAEQHGVDRYDYFLEGHVNQRSTLRIKCPEHGVFYQTASSHLRGHGCPSCQHSAGEKRVHDALTALGIAFETQKRFFDCRHKRSLPFDFFVPSHRLLIEFDGKQHFESSDRWGGESQLELVKKRDQIKTDFANHYGLSLLRIPFWDISNVEDIVLQALIESEPQECKQK